MAATLLSLLLVIGVLQCAVMACAALDCSIDESSLLQSVVTNKIGQNSLALHGHEQYMGCFRDTKCREFRYGPGETGPVSFTLASCSEECRGFAFMALQKGGQCYCDHAYQSDPQTYIQLSDKECETCSTESFRCGGRWANAIYKRADTYHELWRGIRRMDRPEPYFDLSPFWVGSSEVEYLGCFRDTRCREFRYGPGENGPRSFTLASCREECRGFAFAALQHGGQCYCDHGYQSDPQTYVQLPDSECESCSSESFRCGGRWANAIYKVDVTSADLSETLYNAMGYYHNRE